MSVAVIGWLVTAMVAARLAWRLRTQAELVARACHEVRGPLTAAGLALHAARRPGSRADAIAAAERELVQAGALLADLRGAARGAGPRDRLVDVDVDALLLEQTRAWAPVAAGAGRELRLAAPPRGARVRADPRRIAQIVGNLMANALEHGSGPVSVGLHVDDERVRIDVGDAGPGGARIGRRAGGRGRGLAVSAAAASRHGGRLVLEPDRPVVGVELPRVRG